MSDRSFSARIFSPATLHGLDIEYYNSRRPPSTNNEYITITSTPPDSSSAEVTQVPVPYGESDSQGRPIHAFTGGDYTVIAGNSDYENLTSADGMLVSISVVGSSNVTAYHMTYKTPEDQLVKNINRMAIPLYSGSLTHGRAPAYMAEAGGTVTEDDVTYRTNTSPFQGVAIEIIRPVWYHDEYLNLFHMVYADGEFTFEWGTVETTTNTTIWKQDSNNDGYPWIWGWTEDPHDQGSIKYLKTESGLVPICDYLKLAEGLIALQDYLKVETGLIEC